MRFTGTVVTGILLALVFGVVSNAVDSPETLRKIERRRRLQQIGTYERARWLCNVDNLEPADGSRQRDFNASIVDDVRSSAGVFSILDVDTLTSPGLEFGITTYDYQHNESNGHQVARANGGNTTHLCWMYWAEIKDDINLNDRYVRYNSYDIALGQFNQLWPPPWPDFARGGFCRLDVSPSNKAHVVLHMKPDPGADTYSTWHYYYPSPGSDLNFPTALSSGDLGELLWPDCAVGGGQGTGFGNVRHVIAHDGNEDARNLLVYWRYDEGVAVWTGPAIIDSTALLGYVLDACDNTQKLAITYHSDGESDGFNGMNNIAYRESQTAGLGWIDGTELGEGTKTIISTYDDPLGPEAWVHISVAYDHSGALNIIWDEQRIAGQSEDILLNHWNSARGTTRRIVLGYYENPGIQAFNLNLAKPTLGIGDGSESCQGGAETNLDYQYVVYTKMCGETPEEADDMSARGYCSGELYLTGSTDGGNTWSPPLNLTNTRTPGCNADSPYDELCASEHWATIARDIDDHIDIFYILDFDAGGMPQGEGVWTINRAMYLRLPQDGSKSLNRDFVCPVIAPNTYSFITSDPECEYHADIGGANTEELTIMNLGNADLAGTIAVTQGAAWLSVSGSPGYSIAPAGPDEVRTVTMGPVAVEGLNVGHIEVTHNDTTKPSPVDFEIAFFVVNGFQCPEQVVLKTAVASPGVLALAVENSGRFGSQNLEGGLWRYLDSSHAIFDASLLIAHGPQAPGDTVVYHRFYDRDDPGQRGFRATSDLIIDTSSYGTLSGSARAVALLTTADSTIGVGMEWFFPQGPAYADFVIAKYTIWNRTASPISDVVVGLWADMEAVAGNHVVGVQDGVGNHGASDAGLTGRNLVYVYGYDTVDHVPADYFHSSERYSAGVSYLYGRDANGDAFDFAPAPILGGTRDNRENQTGGGPTSHRLYHTIVGAHRDPPGMLGVENWEPFPNDADSLKDAYLFLMLDRGRTLAADGANPEVYVVAWVSDTLTHPAYGPPPGKSALAGGLLEVVDSARAWAQWYELTQPWKECRCECHGDPNCDTEINVFDVVLTVNQAFSAHESIIDPGPFCYTYPSDLDCNGVINVMDLVRLVSVAFRGSDPETAFCDPCAP